MVSSTSPSEQAFFTSLADLYGPELAGAMVSVRELPLVPEIRLYLLNDDYPTHSLQRDAYEKLMSQPPYWAFCWGGGQAMARYLLDHPRILEGRPVVDFGAGSAVAAIAALKAGAADALAADIDTVALQAAVRNAVLNDVHVLTGTRATAAPDSVVLAADICYEEAGLAWVQEHLSSGGRLLVADSRLDQLASRLPGVSQVAEYTVKTFPDLDEHECFAKVRLYSNFR